MNPVPQEKLPARDIHITITIDNLALSKAIPRQQILQHKNAKHVEETMYGMVEELMIEWAKQNL